MSAIFSNTLKSQVSHLHDRKPKNNSPVLLKRAVFSSVLKLSVRVSVLSSR